MKQKIYELKNDDYYNNDTYKIFNDTHFNYMFNTIWDI